ncbi:MAG: MAPEG family protein [Pseudomonadota bacterium]|nr:MAPEG family protein [Pseudomonadota bacterium]
MLLVSVLSFSALAALYLYLSFGAIKLRQREKIGLGHGKNSTLGAIMRAQTNLVEYSVWFMGLLLCAELSQASFGLILAPALLFVLARFWHALAFVASDGLSSKGRVYGTMGSILSVMFLIGLNGFLLIQ